LPLLAREIAGIIHSDHGFRPLFFGGLPVADQCQWRPGQDNWSSPLASHLQRTIPGRNCKCNYRQQLC
jgi:hypothetical protein